MRHSLGGKKGPPGCDAGNDLKSFYGTGINSRRWIVRGTPSWLRLTNHLIHVKFCVGGPFISLSSNWAQIGIRSEDPVTAVLINRRLRFLLLWKEMLNINPLDINTRILLTAGVKFNKNIWKWALQNIIPFTILLKLLKFRL